jgi:transcriptional regulator with XRE-family HTH domain
MATLTALGRAVRKLRIDKGETLKKMADALNVSPAFLSAVEIGRKKAPDELVSKIAMHFSLDEERASELHKAAAADRNQYRISIKTASAEAREVVSAFARRFEQLDAEELRKLKEILMK